MLPMRTPRVHVPARAAGSPSALAAGTASAFVPGLGQLLQHRYATAALHFCSVGAYAIAAFRVGGGWWSLGALIFNAWSVLDGIWWARESGHDDARAPMPQEPTRRHLPGSTPTASSD
jgi:hypothetical protein